MLKLPALAGGKQEGTPIERLERAVGRAVRSLAKEAPLRLPLTEGAGGDGRRYGCR